MAARTALRRRLSTASVVVMGLAAAALSYLLVLDARSSWVDRLLGAVLIFMVAYGVRLGVRNGSEELVPSWRPRNFFDAVLPFVFPFFLITQAEDRESPLVWLGWALLAASVAVQILIWRVEKADAVATATSKS